MKKGFLRSRGEYLKTYKGFAVKLPLIVVYAKPNGLDRHRFGCTTPRTVGKAVVRNKFRRWAKEIYRKTVFPGDLALDLHVFVGSRNKDKQVYKEVSFNDYRKQIFEGLTRAFRHFKMALDKND